MLDPMTIIGTTAAIGGTISLIDIIIKNSSKIVKRITTIVRQTTDSNIRKLLKEKKNLENKEIEILRIIRNLLKKLKKKLAKEKQTVEETKAMAEDLQEFSNSIQKLKNVKTKKLQIQQSLYKCSKKKKTVDVINIRKVEKVMKDLELMLEQEETQEAEIEEVITTTLEKLGQFEKSTELKQLIQDFMALGKISLIEKEIDEKICAALPV